MHKTRTPLTNAQRQALWQLDEALLVATRCGLFDVAQPLCMSPDSINDVCDAVKDLLDEQQEGDERDAVTL